MDDSSIAALITRVRGHLATMSYQAEERVDFTMLVEALVKTRAALKPFANAGAHAIATACPDDRLVDMPAATAAVWRAAAAAYQGDK